MDRLHQAALSIESRKGRHMAVAAKCPFFFSTSNPVMPEAIYFSGMPNDLKAKLEKLLQQRHADELDLLGQLKGLCEESTQAIADEQPIQPLQTLLQTQLAVLDKPEQQYMQTDFSELNRLTNRKNRPTQAPQTRLDAGFVS